MDVIVEMLGTGILIAVPGLLLIALLMRVLSRSPVFLQCFIRSLLLAIVLTPTIAFHTPHGARGFPAVLALIGNGPRGFADALSLGVLPIVTAWVLIFTLLRLRFRSRETERRNKGV